MCTHTSVLRPMEAPRIHIHTSSAICINKHIHTYSCYSISYSHPYIFSHMYTYIYTYIQSLLHLHASSTVYIHTHIHTHSCNYQRSHLIFTSIHLRLEPRDRGSACGGSGGNYYKGLVCVYMCVCVHVYINMRVCGHPQFISRVYFMCMYVHVYMVCECAQLEFARVAIP
jgi:hypothetical protein